VGKKGDKVGASIHHLAQRLRREQTDAERRLWHRVRQRRLGGFRFRRQFVIGGFIVDFCCRERALVVELDGGHHLERLQADGTRTELLRARGYMVLRFWDSDVLLNTEGVLEQILSILTAPHTLTLSLVRERASTSSAL
jgi:very-short-patch-repair endonuclease